jgi:hypothetical protein
MCEDADPVTSSPYRPMNPSNPGKEIFQMSKGHGPKFLSPITNRRMTTRSLDGK